MAEFETGGHTYRTQKMSARDQLHLLRGLGPLFGPMVEVALVAPGSVVAASRDLNFMLKFFDGFSKMEEAEVNMLVNKCLAVTRRREGGNGTSTWGPPLWNIAGGREQYADIELASLLTICWQVIQENLGGFFDIGSPLPSTQPKSGDTIVTEGPFTLSG